MAVEVTLRDYAEVIEALARRVNRLTPWYYDKEKWKVECMFCGVSGDTISDNRPAHLDTCEVMTIRRFLDKIDSQKEGDK